MATRFYFAAGGGSPVSPTLNNGGEWEHVNTNRAAMRTTVGSTALTNLQYAPDAADDIVDKDALVCQFVSFEILEAQTISAQTCKWQFQCFESNAGNNVSLTIKIFICSRDGTSIKETLLAIRRDATEMNTSLQNRGDSASISSATVEVGDRICVEIGCGGLPVAASQVQGHNCNIRFGEVASGGDLAENDTETGTTFRPWLEFPNTLTFASQEAPRALDVFRHRRAS